MDAACVTAGQSNKIANVWFRETRWSAMGRFRPIALPDTGRSRFPKPDTGSLTTLSLEHFALSS